MIVVGQKTLRKSPRGQVLENVQRFSEHPCDSQRFCHAQSGIEYIFFLGCPRGRFVECADDMEGRVCIEQTVAVVKLQPDSVALFFCVGLSESGLKLRQLFLLFFYIGLATGYGIVQFAEQGIDVSIGRQPDGEKNAYQCYEESVFHLIFQALGPQS